MATPSIDNLPVINSSALGLGIEIEKSEVSEGGTSNIPPDKNIGSPWIKMSSPETKSNPLENSNVSFHEIMSEQLANDLQLKEEASLITSLNPDILEEELLFKTTKSETTDCSDDFMIAQMLQLQFNKEHDENLKKVEQKYNGNNKVSVSFSNYMSSPSKEDDDDTSDSDDDYFEPKNWDSFEANEKSFPAMSAKGYVRVNNEVVTKHDVTMSGRKNACKVMESFPPCIKTGDGGSFDMKLSNKVYNTLKVYSKTEEDRRNRNHDKVEKATSVMAIDQKTRLILYKLINNSILEKVYGVIATGKESVVVYAKGGSIQDETITLGEIPEECAIKVFKTSLNEFKTRDKYIKDDFRFKDRFTKQNPRKIIRLWSEKEMHNLNRMTKANIPCPKVILLKKHILILSFIGKDMKPAPKLKEVQWPSDDNNSLLRSAYEQSITGMKKMYDECRLIHSDLSEFNILWHENKCYFIDVSQSVEPNHPQALEFLYRDCTNICNFFAKRTLEDMHTPESLFTFISGFKLDGSGAEIYNQIINYEKDLELLTFQKPQKFYPFDYCWEKSAGEK